jgi:hypothetical protein
VSTFFEKLRACWWILGGRAVAWNLRVRRTTDLVHFEANQPPDGDNRLLISGGSSL